MIPPEVVKDIDEIKTPSNRVLVTILLLGIMALAGWIKVLTGNDTADRKEAYAVAERKCAEETALLKNRISTLEWKYDSLISKAVYDKQQTIILLQQMLEKSRIINNKIKRQK